MLKGISSFQALVYTIDYSSLNVHNRNTIIQTRVCTRVAEVFKMECAQERQQYSNFSVYKRCSSVQEEQQCSIWSVHKISRSIQAGVCTRGAAVFKMECTQVEQHYSRWSVQTRSSSIQPLESEQEEQQCSSYRTQKGAAVLKLECAQMVSEVIKLECAQENQQVSS